MIITNEIRVYQTVDGSEPFSLWLSSLDYAISARIDTRIDRLALGNLGDWKRIGVELFELRMHFGPGYRVYFTVERNCIILLLCGGDKGSQQKDIKKAEFYLEDYKKRFRWKTLKS